VVLLIVSLVLLLAMLHPRFRKSRLLPTGVVIASAIAAYTQIENYRLESKSNAVACDYPLQPTKEAVRCYDPADPVQFARHLSECKIVPGQPPGATDGPILDSRSVPCDYFDQFQNKPLQPPQTASHT